jgi:hypothetical protein
VEHLNEETGNRGYWQDDYRGRSKGQSADRRNFI